MATLHSRIRHLETLLPHAMASDREALRRVLIRLRRSAEPTLIAAKVERLEARLSASVAVRALRRKSLPAVSYPEGLPITAHKEKIASAIRQHPVVIVSGDTGSGKSTQIPKICLEAGRGIDGMIGHTQPRRIAAVSVAHRIAEELGQPLGESVGYKIRFRDRTARNAYIKIMTDGILLAETQADRFLTAYDTIIVDEAHERSLNIDFILGYLKGLLGRRPDLKVIVTSATIDTETFSRAFDGAPVIEVSGRMYPVEVRYEPAGDNDQEGDLTHVELAVRVVRLLLREGRSGDILVFMPTEQDIRETCEMIGSSIPPGTLVMPLFARLTATEQRRVFHAGSRRKVVVATNVAETSITIPGITYVVDTGLARIPRYSPRTRTTAMPVAPISRSSADQRKGRCGRVANGVCIRLFAEEDYLRRPLYTPPELLRANLADVILRMVSLGLGDVSQFPFIDPPDAKSIRDGFNLLYELGALRERYTGAVTRRKRKETDHRAESIGQGQTSDMGESGIRADLTATGRMMARIPLDPRLARMLIEAREEGCTAEIAVIAAALSIQDPRERPAEKTAEADRAHSAFNDAASDFMTLLNIWRCFRQAQQKAGSTSALKRFCRDHFLSYPRMREWDDIHQQIGEILKEFGMVKAEGGKGDFAKIHRCILSGFLSNIAVKKDKNLYRAAKDREVMIFPGSGLFNAAGGWIVAAELVETSRLFARTVATIDPGWLEGLGGQLCRSTYRDPRWDPKRGEVVATEQVTLFGLVVVTGRTVSYGPIQADEATDIFIRQALIEGRLGRHFAFLEHNQKQAAKILELENRLRRRDLLVDDEALAAFYRQRLADMYDLRSLGRLIKTRGGDHFLRMAEDDLMNYRPDEGVLGLFPERIPAAGRLLELRYRFEPAADEDGVTLRVPSTLASAVSPSTLEWLVPGLLREKIEVLVKGLPKELRKRLVPLNETIDVILAEMPQQQGPFPTAMTEFIQRRFGVDIPASAWTGEALPDYLKMRVAITSPDGYEVISGRGPAVLRSIPSAAGIPPEVRRRWERSGITRWDFGDLPDVVTGERSTPAPWVAYPGLEPAPAGVSLKLFARQDLALAVHSKGVAALAGIQISRDIRFLKRSLALPEEVHPAARYFGGARKVEEAMADRVIQGLFAVNVRTEKEFVGRIAAYAPKMIPASRELLYAVVSVLQAYAAARQDMAALAGGRGPLAGIYNQLEADVTRLMPQNFIFLYDLGRLPHLERYLRALAIRAQRVLVDPEKDRLKAEQPQKYCERLKSLLKTLNPESSAEKRRAVEELFWMIEEYKVSIFAQELKTARPVSPKRLAQTIAEIERMA